MQIKINEKVLSIPPFISTSWAHINMIQMKGSSLMITLADGNAIHLSHLSPEMIELIFNYHALYLEKENTPNSVISSQMSPHKKDLLSGLFDQMGEPTIKLAFGSLDGMGMGNAMQHNPAQADLPDLPAELLQKVTMIAKMMVPLDEMPMLQAEQNCNCFHCQIARALHPRSEVSAVEAEEEIKDEELQFQQWTIEQTGDQLFSVTSRLDVNEKYSVYLGQPVGCTCGKQGCEHILAVLKS